MEKEEIIKKIEDSEKPGHRQMVAWKLEELCEQLPVEEISRLSERFFRISEWFFYPLWKKRVAEIFRDVEASRKNPDQIDWAGKVAVAVETRLRLRNDPIFGWYDRDWFGEDTPYGSVNHCESCGREIPPGTFREVGVCYFCPELEREEEDI